MLSPGVGYQPGRRCRPRDMLDSLSAATPSPATHLPSPLTDLPSPRIQCCNHILLCGHNQLLGSRGKFQGGKFELSNILLSPKGKRRGKWKGQGHHCTGHFGKDSCTDTGGYHTTPVLGCTRSVAAQIQEAITSHLSWDARVVCVNEEI